MKFKNYTLFVVILVITLFGFISLENNNQTKFNHQNYFTTQQNSNETVKETNSIVVIENTNDKINNEIKIDNKSDQISTGLFFGLLALITIIGFLIFYFIVF